MKKISAIFLSVLLSVSLFSCDTDKKPEHTNPLNIATDITTEGTVTHPYGISPDSDLTLIPFITLTRDEVLGITWYFDKAITRTLKDNLLYAYIGVYDTEKITFRLRLQHFGQKDFDVDRFCIITEDKQSDFISNVNTEENDTYKWEWIDFIPNEKDLQFIKSTVKTESPIKVRAYGESSFNERLLGQAEVNALRDMLFVYECLIGEDISYPVDIAKTPQTTEPVPSTETGAPVYDDFYDNIITNGGTSVLNYRDYSISFPSVYICTNDSSDKTVSISKKEGDPEKIELLYTEGEFKAERVTDSVIDSTLDSLKVKLPDTEISIYSGAVQLTLDGKPAVKYAYRMKFESVTVYVTQYLVEYNSGYYSVAVAEISPGGEIFTSVINSLRFK